jgi:UDP-GlcNAc3NAcA epimerase
MKIVTIVGARPQFIKAALLSDALKKNGITEILIHTGQHYDANMSDIFFEQLGLQNPAYNLHIQAKTHGDMTGKMLVEIEKILMDEMPDWVVVFGDTNSTLAGALAARKLNIPIAHVEAGLRNYDMTIPEEVNRIITDRISDLLLCPTEIAIENLRQEGFESFPIHIVKTDDILSDAVYFSLLKMKENPTVISAHLRAIPYPYILCTVHRQDSTTEAHLKIILDALNKIATTAKIIFPIHPRTLAVLNGIQYPLSPNIHLIDPVGYLDMQYLLQHAQYLITDSGGLQKEAYLHGVYSLLLMGHTPWQELITHQVSVATPLDEARILLAYNDLKQLRGRFDQNLYGSGQAGMQIVEALKRYGAT